MNQASKDENQTIHPETGRDTSRTEFFKLAHRAIQAGEVTQAEVEAIWRPGSRKQNYWSRHLRDLEEWILEKKKLNVNR